jgi:hypothetical protein
MNSIQERKDALRDEARTALLSTDYLEVDYDFTPDEDGSQVELRRTVWFKAYRQRDRDILHQETVAVFQRGQVPDVVRGLVWCVTA